MDTQKIRVANLRQLVKQWGGPVSFAAKLKLCTPSYLVQLTGPNPTRPITEKTARKIELRLGMPAGWLDKTQHGKEETEVDIKAVANVVYTVAAACADAKVELSPAKFADAVTLVYQDMLENGTINHQLTERIVRLAR